MILLSVTGIIGLTFWNFDAKICLNLCGTLHVGAYLKDRRPLQHGLIGLFRIEDINIFFVFLILNVVSKNFHHDIICQVPVSLQNNCLCSFFVLFLSLPTYSMVPLSHLLRGVCFRTGTCVRDLMLKQPMR